MGFPCGNMQRSVTARSRYLANAMYLSRILATKLDHAYSPVSSTGSSSSLCSHLDLGVSTCILQYSNNDLQTDTSVHHHSSLPMRPNLRISMPSGSQLLFPALLLCAIFPLRSIFLVYLVRTTVSAAFIGCTSCPHNRDIRIPLLS